MREYEQEVREQYEIEIKSTRRTRGAFFCVGNADTEVFLMKETLASEKRAALLYNIIIFGFSAFERYQLPYQS